MEQQFSRNPFGSGSGHENQEIKIRSNKRRKKIEKKGKKENRKYNHFCGRRKAAEKDANISEEGKACRHRLLQLERKSRKKNSMKGTQRRK